MHRRLAHRLRHRGLAVGLIVALVAYAALATVVPQRADGAAAVAAWRVAHPWLASLTEALGLHAAFSSPLFLLLAGVLTLSTAACAWERTAGAVRSVRLSGRATRGELARLAARPGIPVRHEVAADPYGAAATALRRLGMQVRSGPQLLEASSGRLGLLGSPVFHWALVLLFVVVALGRLTRAEGTMGIPVGSERENVAASYGRFESGPLHVGAPGFRLRVTDLHPYRDAGGVDRGIAPYVELYRGKTMLRAQRVYPNNPLRYGSLLVHEDGYGLAAWISVEETAGPGTVESQPLVDFDDASPTGTRPVVFDLRGSSGEVIDTVELVIPADRDAGQVLRVMPRAPRARLKVTTSSGEETSAVLAKGESVRLPTGELLRLADVGYYARLSVADDPSVYVIYGLFVLAALALTVSLLLPYRRVLVLLDGEGEDRRLRVLVKQSRSDPLFAERVDSAVREAVGLPPSAEEVSA